VDDDTPGDKDLAVLSRAVGRATVYDRVIDAGLDAVSILVPVVGAAAAAVARQAIPKDRALYEHDFAVEVARRIDLLEAGHVDPASLHTEEWVSDVEEVIETVGSRKQRGKRRYFFAALTNCAVHDRPPEVERKRFLDALERFRPSHLRLLGVFLLPPEDMGDGSTDGYLLARMPGADIENIRLDWGDLQAAGMVDNYPTGMTVTPKAQLVTQSLRAFGRRFAAFIEAGLSDGDTPQDEGLSS
jgi:hypothetical protein